MIKSGIDQQALIDMFAQASAKGTEQLRQAVGEATLRALQGRELTLKNIRGVLGSVSEAAGQGASQNTGAAKHVSSLLDTAVAGMDDALLKAVDANRVALQQLVDRGASLRDTQLKKALGDLDKFEDTLIGAVKKAADAMGDPMAGPWKSVLEKLQAGGTQTGANAGWAMEQLAGQMQTAMRESRNAGLKAAQTLADSYTALVSGVLIGMSDALRQGAAPAPAPAAKKR